ncbi:MAG TPA: von Willebrand factor type A domain-containing protein, partial [Planctomycetota bacterium]|nr:von Willebrand factor type A domain-containing protein [Planctomycetota bacterium]
MHCEQAETLLANHAFNELDAREKASLLEHLAKCPACTAMLAEMRSVAGALKEALEAGEPPRLSPQRRAKLFQLIASAEHKKPKASPPKQTAMPKKPFMPASWRSIQVTWWGKAAAVLIFCIVMAGFLLPSLSKVRECNTTVMRQHEERNIGGGRSEEILELNCKPGDEDADFGGAADEMGWAGAPADDDSIDVPDEAVVVRRYGGLAAKSEARESEETAPAGTATPMVVAKTPGAPPLAVDAEGAEGTFHGIYGSRGGGGQRKSLLRADATPAPAEPAKPADGAIAGVPAAVQPPPATPPYRELNGRPAGDVQKAGEDLAKEKRAAGPALGSGSAAKAAKGALPAAKRPRAAEDADGDALDVQSKLEHVVAKPPALPKPTDAPIVAGKAGGLKTDAPHAEAMLEDSERSSRDGLDDLRAQRKDEVVRRRERSGIVDEGESMSEADEMTVSGEILNAKGDATQHVESYRKALESVNWAKEFSRPVEAAEGKDRDQDAYKAPEKRTTSRGSVLGFLGGGFAAGREYHALKEAPVQLDQGYWTTPPVDHERVRNEKFKDYLSTAFADGKERHAEAEKKPAFVRLTPDEAARQEAQITILSGNESALGQLSSEETAPTADEWLEEETDKDASETITVFRAMPVNPFVMAEADRFSTFALDVDTASYSLARNYIRRGQLPPVASVRMEEFVNAFDYNYPKHTKGVFTVHAEAMPAPFGRDLALLKVGVQGRVLGREGRKPAHLVFAVDVSGSMGRADRMPLVQHALGLLAGRLSGADRVSMITFGGGTRLVLEAVPAGEKKRIIDAVNALQCGGSTNLLDGVTLAYDVAQRAFRAGEINRVILCSDGVANIGITEADDMLKKVGTYRDHGIT